MWILYSDIKVTFASSSVYCTMLLVNLYETKIYIFKKKNKIGKKEETIL